MCAADLICFYVSTVEMNKNHAYSEFKWLPCVLVKQVGIHPGTEVLTAMGLLLSANLAFRVFLRHLKYYW